MHSDAHLKESITTSLLQEIIETSLDAYKITVVLRLKNRPVPSILSLSETAEYQDLPSLSPLTFYTPSKYPVLLNHYAIHKQFVPNICGYHALYSIIETIKYLKYKSFDRGWHIAHPAYFWKFKNRISHYLYDEGKKFDSDYWSEHNTLQGDLERTFLRHLLDNNAKIMKLFQDTDEFSVDLKIFSFQFKHVQMSSNEIVSLQESIDKFISAENKEVVLCIMLGVTNHWTTLLAHKYNSFTEYFFMDSRNVPYLNYTEDQIAQHVEESNQKRREDGRKILTPFQIMINKQSVADLQRTLEILMNCLLGNTTLPSVVIEDKIGYMLENYYMIEAEDEYMRLLTFLNSGFPATFIEGEYIRLLMRFDKKYIPIEIMERVEIWYGCIEADLKNRRVKGHVEIFKNIVMTKLKKLISSRGRL
jgi:hypothetical protein